MNKKLRAILTFTLLSTSLIFGGCNTNTTAEAPGNNEVVELKFWYAFKDKIEANNQALVKEFNESQSKIHVTAEYQGTYDDLHAKTKSAFTAGEAPEVTIVEIASIQDFSKSGILENLTTFVDKDKMDITDYQAGLMENSYVDDKLYAIPYLRSTPILYMNETLLKAAGLDPSGPKNWTELEDYCKKLSKDGTVGMTYPVNIWITEGFLAQAGGSILSDDNTKATVNSPEMIKGLEFLKKMNTEGTINIVTGTEGGDKAKIDFKNQKSAMFFSSTADLTYNLNVAKESGFTLNTAFMPADKNYGVPTGGCNMVMLSKLPKEKQDASWEFIKFMTDKERTIKASTNTGYLPTRKSAVDSEEMQKLYKEIPQYKIAVDQLQYGKGRPMVETYAEIQKIAKESQERIFLKNADIKTEVEKLDADINAILKK
ncbi:ABC transporter substrate-binding protein [Clostridium vincentii]|uniref:sn-glycerol-3-phosphate-binding periplasmic protein UgpB n=1 Tax=Clostridium vincentii TaxID=52704 RepID=A0A2T0BIW8_9CLOT|nr:ABC transporter substrate-binding protein [Clostridium vincentii]PRR83797.1 sn-glycerol-3-phosphate-binding periplasmic protein UgpB precursor [Clostridium vincentii]